MKNAEDAPIILSEESIKDKIYTIRGQRVMLDVDLAKIYGYTTKTFNQQVKNNIQKFDEDFRFQLTKEETENLRSKFLTSSWGGARYLPHAFTEQGIYMLMTVLKGDLATRQSKSLIHSPVQAHERLPVRQPRANWPPRILAPCHADAGKHGQHPQYENAATKHCHQGRLGEFHAELHGRCRRERVPLYGWANCRSIRRVFRYL